MKINFAKLEVAMANACISTGELSKKTNLNYSTLTRIKSGMQSQPATIGKIAKALGVRVEELIETEAATSNQFNRDSENNQN